MTLSIVVVSGKKISKVVIQSGATGAWLLSLLLCVDIHVHPIHNHDERKVDSCSWLLSYLIYLEN